MSDTVVTAKFVADTSSLQSGVKKAATGIRGLEGDVKKAAGGFGGGRVPYGWKSINGQLVEDAGEQRIVGELVRLRRLGWSYGRIAGYLNERGIPTKSARTWWPRTVSDTIAYHEQHGGSGGADRVFRVAQRENNRIR
jgi:hypothetical protein